MPALREVIASFTVDVDKAGNLAKGEKQIDGMTDKIATFGKGLIAAFAVDRVVEFTKSIFEQADVLAKQSKALGVSTGWLQGWEHAAQLSGSSAEEFSNAFTKFSRNVAEAGDAATGPAAAAFKTLGVAVKDATGKLGEPQDLLDGVVTGLQAIEDPAKRTQVAMDLFGKSGAHLLPLLSQGAEGIAKLRAEVGELGATYDDAFLENAQEFNDNTDRLKLGLRGLAIQVIGPMLPDLVRFSSYLVQGAKSIVALFKDTNVARGGLLALGTTALPLVISGLGSLAALAWEVILPFLALDDALTFLAGGDSLIGRGLDKLGGAGTGEAVRKWCETAGSAIKSTFIGALDLLRIAFSDTDAASSKLWEKFELDTRGVEQTIDSIVSAVKLLKDAFTDLDTLKQGANDFLDLVTSPFDTEEDKATKVQRHRDAITAGAPEIPRALPATPANQAIANAYEGIAAGAGTYGPLAPLRAPPTAPLSVAPPPSYLGAYTAPPPSYLGAYTAARATATAPAAPTTTNTSHVTTNAPISTTVNVTVQSGGQELGNRVGQATGKAVAVANLRTIKAALVPTPTG